MTTYPTDSVAALERETRALRLRVAELERQLRRSKQGTPQPLGVAISEREALLAEAERIANMGTWVWDAATDQVVWSHGLYRILDYDPETCRPTREAFFARLHPGDRDRFRETSQRIIATGVSEQTDYRILMPDGTVRHVVVDGAVLFDDGGEVARAVGSVMDVTESLRTAESLRLTAERLAEAQRIGNMGHFEWNPTTQQGSWSDQIYRILERPLDEPARFEELDAAVHPGDRERFRESSMRLLSLGESESDVFRIVLPNDRIKYLQISATLVEDRDRGGFIVRGTIADTTERIVLETTLRDAQKLEAIGRLAGGVAHDYNNLLTTILGNIELLEPDQRPAEIDEIERAALSAANVTRKLLAYGRRAMIQPKVGSLAEATRRTLSLLRSAIGEDIVLRLNVPEVPWPVLLDTNQLAQMLLNLASNARDAMPEGGTIDMTIENHHAGANSAFPGDWVVMTIADSGTGMDPDTQEHAFEPFYTTKAAGLGTGLGLAMVYGSMKQTGGYADLDSEPGRGTTVRLYFPRRHTSRAAAEGSAETAKPPARARLLLVEDEPAVARVLAALLEGAGYEIVTTNRAAEALELWAEQDFDALITDVVMPEMTGPELVLRLRDGAPDLRVLFITGYAREADTVQPMSGRTAMLVKPFRRPELLRTVSMLLGVNEGTPAGSELA